MKPRTRALIIAVIACAVLAAPTMTSAGEVTASRARVTVKPRVGGPHTKMVVFASGFRARETLLVTQYFRSEFGNLFKRKFTYRASADGTFELSLQRPQRVGRYETCFRGRSSGRKACGTHRVDPVAP
jgi:hypothetical protein